MRVFGLWLLVFGLAALGAAAQPIDWFSAERATTELNISSAITIEQNGPNPYVENLRADILFIPRNSERSAIRELQSTPPATTTHDRISYTWNKPALGTVPFSYQATVETTGSRKPVLAAIPWPTTFPKELHAYTLPTPHIDSTHPAIIGQAQYLARGHDDLFSLVSATAYWVKTNVHYNLSTLTAEVSQPASWVLENKYGVCDEITSLFIALLRSLGIPARFVSGVAYTASPQFPQGWGAHGWAEVYFPGIGWLPFDPTFGEYGWVDPSHIALKESKDPQEPTSIYEWNARDARITAHDLTISAALKNTNGKIQFPLRLRANAHRPRVGFGSHNLIVLTAENPTNQYYSTEFTLARVRDMTIIGSDTQHLLIAPKSTARAFWHVKVNDNLDPKFQYELPIHLYTIDNQTAETIFHTARYDVAYSAADIETSKEELALSDNRTIRISCTLENDRITTSQGKAHCVITNTQNQTIAVTACHTACQDILLGPLERKTVPYALTAPRSGTYPVSFNATFREETARATLTLVRLDNPEISIAPASLSTAAYGETLPVTFLLTRESLSIPQNLTATLSAVGAQATVPLGNLDAQQEVTITVPTSQLWQEEPTITITLTYHDTFGEKFERETEIPARVLGVPWYKRAAGAILALFIR
ncbi:hypothetical protein C4580_05980 [Candidatus Woesearchaeota archaeon]|nr:MAG: hypothetical protein C4580_05980 [Candidatus Woesearchaeota archaeon]